MPAYSVQDLRKQFDRARRLGWLPFFVEAAAHYGHDPADLLAVGSRETNLDPRYLSHAGDHGNGFGLMQIDKRYFPQWVVSGGWRDAREGIFKGAQVLAEKRDEIRRKRGERVTWKTRKGQAMSFTGAPFTEEQLRLIAFAAYNSGIAGYHHFSKSGDPDRGTTGADYARDVNGRAKLFRKWLAAEDIDTAAAAPQSATGASGVAAGTPAPDAPDLAARADATAPAPDAAATGETAPSVGAGGAASTPAQPVAGGGAGDPTQYVTGGTRGWARDVAAWVAALFTAASGHVERAFSLTPEIQKWLLIGVAVLAIVWLVSKAVAQWQVRRIHADPTKVNVA
jgi:hypothetical protein